MTEPTSIGVPNTTRIEIIGPGGREHVGYYTPGIVLEWQDEGSTLKVFVGERDPAVKDALAVGLRRDMEGDTTLWRRGLMSVRPVEPRKPSEGATGADEHDRPLWSAMDK